MILWMNEWKEWFYERMNEKEWFHIKMRNELLATICETKWEEDEIRYSMERSVLFELLLMRIYRSENVFIRDSKESEREMKGILRQNRISLTLLASLGESVRKSREYCFWINHWGEMGNAGKSVLSQTEIQWRGSRITNGTSDDIN